MLGKLSYTLNTECLPWLSVGSCISRVSNFGVAGGCLMPCGAQQWGSHTHGPPRVNQELYTMWTYPSPLHCTPRPPALMHWHSLPTYYCTACPHPLSPLPRILLPLLLWPLYNMLHCITLPPRGGRVNWETLAKST